MRTATKKPTGLQITEKAWSAQFKELFKMLGWEGYHPFLSIHSERGWPDWSLVNESQGRLVFVELKTEVGKVSDKQQRWHELLRSVGCEVYVWRPSDFDTAARILSRSTSPQDSILARQRSGDTNQPVEADSVASQGPGNRCCGGAYD